jgi:RNA polymerase sigma factor (sigma-70 family)
MTSETFGQAYTDGLHRTVRFLESRGVRHDSATDIAHAAWVRGWERLEQLRDERTIVTWVNSIALNQFRRAIRRERRVETLYDMADPGLPVNWAAIDLSRILKSCSPGQRKLLQAQLEGNTAKEIAEHTGASPTAIRLRFLRARRAARELMDNGCRPATHAA